MNLPSNATLKRFKQFAQIMKAELGIKMTLTHDSRVIVHATEFGPQNCFHSLQAAIDSFSRYLPTDFVNK